MYFLFNITIRSHHLHTHSLLVAILFQILFFSSTDVFFCFVCLVLFCFCFLGPQPWHMELPRLGVKLEPQLKATATPDPSHIYDLHHSSWQRWILNPLREARDRTHNPMVPSQIHFCCVTRYNLHEINSIPKSIQFSDFFFFLSFLGPNPWHMEVVRLGGDSEL